MNGISCQKLSLCTHMIFREFQALRVSSSTFGDSRPSPSPPFTKLFYPTLPGIAYIVQKKFCFPYVLLAKRWSRKAQPEALAEARISPHHSMPTGRRQRSKQLTRLSHSWNLRGHRY